LDNSFNRSEVACVFKKLHILSLRLRYNKLFAFEFLHQWLNFGHGLILICQNWKTGEERNLSLYEPSWRAGRALGELLMLGPGELSRDAAGESARQKAGGSSIGASNKNKEAQA
jgi:hypothetical protein